MNSRQKEILQYELDKEKDLLRDLKHVYGQAQDDVVNKIIDLSRRRDMENLQTIIYQKQYQEVIKGQIDGILDKLHSDQYSTISEYINDCYSDAFIGVLYDLQGQGIPLIFPIDQDQVVKAVQIDSKLSKSLYESLDMADLKKAVRMEVSRGIVNGSSWNQIGAELAKKMGNTPFQKAINNSIRIARTEGHRVQNQAKLDSMNAAKEKGADVVKQWDSTLDGKTRETHRKLDGQIRELDEDFEVDGKKASAPGMFGDPAEDCNCRCTCLQRARWALGSGFTKMDNFTKELQNFDSHEDYEAFKKAYWSDENIKYMNYVNDMEDKYGTKNFEEIIDSMSEREYAHYQDLMKSSPLFISNEQSLRTKNGGEYGVNWTVVKSKEYTKRFETLSNNKKANELTAQRSRNALVNRAGKNTEELYAISLSSGKDISSIIDQNIPFGVMRTPKFNADVTRAESNGEKILFIHNHPRGLPPSVTDINELLNHKNAVGITVGHDGSIYYYSRPMRKIENIDESVAIRKNKDYNGIEFREQVIKELSKQFGFEFKKL